MSPTLTLDEIKDACGFTSYTHGRSYFQAGRVTSLSYNPDTLSHKAAVTGSKRYRVTVSIDDVEGIEGSCTCPAFYPNYFCKHIAAVLFKIHSPQTSYVQRSASATTLPMTASASTAPAPGISKRDILLTNSLLSLFSSSSSATARGTAETDEPLCVEYIVNAHARSSSIPLFSLEIKIGPKRPLVVQKINELLKNIKQNQKHFFTNSFSYDPALHTFGELDQMIIDQLVEVHRVDVAYRSQFGSSYSGGYRFHNADRHLLIPPNAWEKLLPLLVQASARLYVDEMGQGAITVTNEPLPLKFRLSEANEQGYRLDSVGLKEIVPMPDYGFAIVVNRLHKLDPSLLTRIAELRTAFQPQAAQEASMHVWIPVNKMDPFLDRVVPQFRRIGHVDIAEHITDRIMNAPLRSKLYLDLTNELLTARLEFHYGDIVLTAANIQAPHTPPEERRILVRDSQQEQQVLDFLRQVEWAPSRSDSLELADEQAVYKFLYHLLPQLETVSDIYVTSALRAAMHKTTHTPKASVDIDHRTNWLHVQFSLEGIDDSDIRTILRSLVEKKKYVKLSGGAFLSLEADDFQELGDFIDETGIRSKELSSGSIKLPIMRGFALLDAKESMPQVKLGKALREMFDNLRNPDNLEFAVPDSLSPIMRDYQKIGFQWMGTLSHYGFGGILADDMGLGKTLQAIAFLLSERQRNTIPDTPPALIVCPASLVYNWRNELHKFAPELRTAVAAGGKLERSGVLDELADIDVLITSYPLLRRDLDQYTVQRFSCLILDEAQAIKNHTTQTAQAVKDIQADKRFALTGTPVENRAEELWSIFDAVFPDLFAGKDAFNKLKPEQIAMRVRLFVLRRNEAGRAQGTARQNRNRTTASRRLQQKQDENFGRPDKAAANLLPPGAVRRELQGGFRQAGAVAGHC
ncbi:SNF2 helicase associated domain-containing protein [Paenibacillus cymbidii]|uniref:SNF2 helicase associated domain-containing protein n=1 Tax=Paenibacillus cymbidii TaxID=1639034 RepID=UPI001F49018A|nr:SNF2 helicase associated domain-containing protein [Paenibacillus cymbidii]